MVCVLKNRKEHSMYDKEFVNIYDNYGWNEFSIVMGNAILEFLASENNKIKNHLDLACGVGTLCHLFHSQNIPTKGVDISKDMISLARKKYKDIPFEIADILKFQTEEKFTIVTCTCDAINHILKEEELEILFQNVYSYLEKEGYFIFDIINKKEILLNQNFRSERGENAYVEYYLAKKEDNLISNHLKVYQDNTLITEETIIEKLYTNKQIVALAQKIGFQIIKSDSHIRNEKYNVNNKIFFILKK